MTVEKSHVTDQLTFRQRPVCITTPLNIFIQYCYRHEQENCKKCSQDSAPNSPLRFGNGGDAFAEQREWDCLPLKKNSQDPNHYLYEPVETPLFWLLPPNEIGSAPKWSRPKNYICHHEPTDEEWKSIIEYDADSDDESFLVANLDIASPLIAKEPPEKRKKNRTKIKRSTFDLFESLIDFFEKTSFSRWKERVHLQYSRLGSKSPEVADDDAPCSVCNDGESEDADQIVFCDGCNIAVHQSCYGIADVPTDSWFCDRCNDEEERDEWESECVLCTERSGALKQTEAGLWCHVVCALWLPEASFRCPKTMSPVLGISKINRKRFELTCCLCQQKKGACIQCSCPSCTKAFHPMCARRRGLFIEIIEKRSGSSFVSYCQQHSMSQWIEKCKKQWEKEFLSSKTSKTSSLLHKAITAFSSAKCLPDFIVATHQHWIQKRKKRKPPLIRRLRLEWETAEEYFKRLQKKTRKAEALVTPEEYISLSKIRLKLESLRIVLDMVWKREKRKKELLDANISFSQMLLKLATRNPRVAALFLQKSLLCSSPSFSPSPSPSSSSSCFSEETPVIPFSPPPPPVLKEEQRSPPVFSFSSISIPSSHLLKTPHSPSRPSSRSTSSHPNKGQSSSSPHVPSFHHTNGRVEWEAKSPESPSSIRRSPRFHRPQSPDPTLVTLSPSSVVSARKSHSASIHRRSNNDSTVERDFGSSPNGTARRSSSSNQHKQSENTSPEPRRKRHRSPSPVSSPRQKRRKT